MISNTPGRIHGMVDTKVLEPWGGGITGVRDVHHLEGTSRRRTGRVGVESTELLTGRRIRAIAAMIVQTSRYGVLELGSVSTL